MRRTIGFILAGLGTFLIIIAVLLPAWVAGNVIKWPLNGFMSIALRDSNATYFSASKLRERSGVTIEAVHTFKGDAAKGTSSTAVWNEYDWVHDVTHNFPIQSITRTMAFNRKTAELVNCCGANFNGHTSVRQRGIAGYMFPMGARKQTYQAFDPTLLRPEPFTYQGTGTVRGIQAYLYTENVPPTPMGPSPLDPKQTEYYENHATYWVDPVTGLPLDVDNNQTLTQRDAAGALTQILFHANLITTPASVSTLVSRDNTARTQISLITLIVPLTVGIIGGAALVAGLLIALRAGPEAGPVPAPAPADATAELPVAERAREDSR